ncbi:M14-type cytosolic carboxypeptidase [Pseudocolwellia sp. HL-MZ7]|uniref:M14 family metallopeptidase n=1 Tax=Pseudocolwellia sp. HL-MZ7 TaxID=3400627 RepID=UPI003CF655F9
MKKSPLIYFLLLSSFFLTSCKSNQIVSNNNVQTCSTGNVRLTADFDSGRMDECTLVAENEYLITLIPENTPINSSPWYAFKVEADQSTDITITLKVRGHKHRYMPKVSLDGKKWQRQQYKLEDGRLTMKLTASTQPVTIAAQEIINNQYYIDWAKKLTANSKASHSLLGNSTQGRPIYKIEHRNAKTKEWLVILGRQHPPEITGALALFPFVETLLAKSELSNHYLNNYNILIIPNINPDGVYAGNWRHNIKGVDLNRDWKNFNQVETKQINEYLEQLVAQGQKVSFAVDFHSTHKDIFYTMPVSYGLEKPYLVKHWLLSLDDETANFDVIMQPGSNSNKGVSKQYFADKYNVHAITYEMGDNTNRDDISHIAHKAATTLMSTMLSKKNHNIE